MQPPSDYLDWNVQIMTPKYLQKEISQTIFQVAVFTTKIHYTHPTTHSFMPEPRLRVGFAMAEKKKQKTSKATKAQHQATTEPEISGMLRCLPPVPALPPWSTESHDCDKGWLCCRCCCCILGKKTYTVVEAILDGILCWCSYDNVTVACIWFRTHPCSFVVWLSVTTPKFGPPFIT